MNTLPPEMILEIYSKMTAKSAHAFRQTCRAYYKIFYDYPRAISNLIPSELKIEVSRRVELFELNLNFGNKKLHIFLNVNDENPHKDDTALFDLRDVLSRNAGKEKIRVLFSVTDHMDALGKLLASLSEHLLIQTLTLRSRGERTFGDDFIETYLNNATVAKMGVLTFENCVLGFTTPIWNRFLCALKPVRLVMQNCILDVDTIFNEEGVQSGLNKATAVQFQRRRYQPQDTIEGPKHLLRYDNIPIIDLLGQVFEVDEALAKMKRFVEGDFRICRLNFNVKRIDLYEFGHLVDTIAERIPTRASGRTWRLSSRNGRRVAEVVVLTSLDDYLICQIHESATDRYREWQCRGQLKSVRRAT